MNAQSRKKLEQYKRNEPQNTEGVEQNIIREATRLQDRAKWAKMLSTDGIERVVLIEKKEAIKPTIIRRLAPYALGLAATIAFLVVIFMPSNDTFDNMILKNQKEAVEVRMGSNEDIAAWKKAMEAYRNKRYEDAAQSINLIPQPTSEQSFYLALSLMYQKQPDFVRAASIFKPMVDKKDAVYEEEARWFLAYSQFKAGQKAEAKAILEGIVAKKGYNYEKAKMILEGELK